MTKFSIKSPLNSPQVATVISATMTWELAGIRAIGWGWTGVIWLYNILTYLLLDPIKFAVRYALSGRAWSLVVNQRVSMPNYIFVQSYTIFCVGLCHLLI